MWLSQTDKKKSFSQKVFAKYISILGKNAAIVLSCPFLPSSLTRTWETRFYQRAVLEFLVHYSSDANHIKKYSYWKVLHK